MLRTSRVIASSLSAILGAACAAGGAVAQKTVAPERVASPAGPARYVVDPSPVTTIGLAPTSAEYALGETTGGGLVGDSLIVVMETDRVGVYGFDGVFRRWAITSGDGPGEVREIETGGVLYDGTIWVYDYLGLRCTAVDPSGELVSELRLPWGYAARPNEVQVIGPAANGDWWIERMDLDQAPLPGNVFRVPTEILRLGRDGAVDTVWSGEGDLAVSGGEATLRGNTWVESGALRSVYLSKLLTAPYQDGVLLAWSDSSFVDLLHPDGTRTRFGSFPSRHVPWDPGPITEEIAVADLPIPPVHPVRLKGSQTLRSLPTYYPQIYDIYVDSDGAIWAQQTPVEDDEAGSVFFRLAEDGPTAILSSSGVRRIAETMGRGWVLSKDRSEQTREVYVTLHRFVRESPAGR